jgi:hypothetical protein
MVEVFIDTDLPTEVGRRGHISILLGKGEKRKLAAAGPSEKEIQPLDEKAREP